MHDILASVVVLNARDLIREELASERWLAFEFSALELFGIFLEGLFSKFSNHDKIKIIFIILHNNIWVFLC